MVNIATWNINGIKARHENLVKWLKEENPDVVALQETKCIDENFPKEEIESLGYNVEIYGQKSFNGVALLAKMPFEEVNKGLYKQDEQARFIEGVFSVGKSVLRVACLYMPNGNPVNDDGNKLSDKFKYKLQWIDKLKEFCVQRLELEEPLVVTGDFNVIPHDIDCYDPKVWEGDALARDDVRQKFREICNLGFVEAVRNTSDEAELYTFWDFQKGAWQKNNGIRIDHFLLSPEISGKLVATSVDKHTRAWEKPSDHVPVRIEVDL